MRMRSASALLAVVLAGTVTACTSGPESAEPAQPATATASASQTAVYPPPGPPSQIPSIVPVKIVRDYRLNMHCGVRLAMVGDSYFIATPEVSDGNGNAPRGWKGTGSMTIYADGTAKYSDSSGHVAMFKRTSDPGYLCD